MTRFMAVEAHLQTSGAAGGQSWHYALLGGDSCDVGNAGLSQVRVRWGIDHGYVISPFSPPTEAGVARSELLDRLFTTASLPTLRQRQ
jgi:hypothetical protein